MDLTKREGERVALYFLTNDNPKLWAADNRFQLEQDDDLNELLKRQHYETIQDSITVTGFFGSSYRICKEDEHGDTLTYLLAGQFKDINSENENNQNFIQYIRLLDPKTKIIIYWF